MSKPAFNRIGAFIAVSFLTLLVLTACEPRTNSKAQAEAILRADITELSPTPAVLGGTFYVTDITWEDDDTAIVAYEDGHIALMARAEIDAQGDTVTIQSFTLTDDETTSGRPLSKEGEFCGGIAAFQCAAGLTCKYDGTYPDAGGTCVDQ